jgi:hypothetical protein
LLSTYPHPEVVVVGAQHGFRIGEENPALRNSFRIPCGRPLIKKNLNFPYANMKWFFFFLTIGKYNDPSLFTMEKKRIKTLKILVPQ